MAGRAEVPDDFNTRYPLVAFKWIRATPMSNLAEMGTEFVAWMDLIAHICAVIELRRAVLMAVPYTKWVSLLGKEQKERLQRN